MLVKFQPALLSRCALSCSSERYPCLKSPRQLIERALHLGRFNTQPRLHQSELFCLMKHAFDYGDESVPVLWKPNRVTQVAWFALNQVIPAKLLQYACSISEQVVLGRSMFCEKSTDPPVAPTPLEFRKQRKRSRLTETTRRVYVVEEI